MGSKLNLPAELKPFEAVIRASSKPFLRIVPKDADVTRLWESKIGGLPYLPKDYAYPVDMEGNQLLFLAQINFAETPALPGFPRKGILQFYVSDDPLYGLDLNDSFAQDGFRVLYFADVIEDETALIADFSFLRKFKPDPIDPDFSFPLNFSLGEECVPVVDFHFDRLLGEDFFYQFAEKEWEIWEAYNESVRSSGHKLGGYAHFTQEDPRREQMESLQLLFQIDTDERIHCAWGDYGVANFFIDPKDLKARDFARVLYHWDCL